VIRYELQGFQFVDLKAYDVAGREVATLAHGFKNPGMHEVIFEGSRLASGIYICRLSSGGLTQVRKMALVK